MADQRERIVLEVDASGVATTLSSANRSVANLEASFARAGQTVEQRLLTKIATLKERMAGDPMELKRLDALQQQVLGKIKTNLDAAAGGLSGFGQKVRDAIQNPMQAAGQAVGGLVDKLGPMGIGLAAGAAAFVAIAKAGWSFAKELGSMSDRIGDTASRMGLSIREAEGFRYAMNRAGGDMGTLENIMRKLSTEIESGGENLTKMGLRFRDVQTGDLRPMSGMILELSARLKALPEGPIRNAAAIKVLGRAALEVLPDLLELGEGMKRFGEMKVGWTEADIKQGDEFRKKVADITAQWDTAILHLKQPIAAAIIFTVSTKFEGQGEIYQNWGGGWADKLRNAMLTGRWEIPAGRQGPRQGPMPETTGEVAARSEQLRSIIQNDAAVRARLQSTEEERLTAAKKRLDELGKDLSKGVIFSAERFSEFDKQKQIVTAIEARIKATKELTKANEDMAQAAMKAATESLGILGKSIEEINLKTETAFAILRQARSRQMEYIGSEEMERTGTSLSADWRIKEMQRDIDAVNDRTQLELDALEKIDEADRRYREQRFSEIKGAFEGLFDAALLRARSFWDAMKGLAYAIFLTPIKDAFGIMMANAMGGGYGGAGGAGGYRGILGGLGAAAAGYGGTGGATALPGMMPGWSGSTGGGGGYGGLLGGLLGLKSMAWNAGSISLGAGSATTAAGIGGIGGGLAGFVTSPAGLMSGGMLASMGLMRGGKLGAAMSAGGGALVGAALGTMIFPGIGTALGAGIGALIGGGAGLVRMLFKSATDKAREKIKAIYGIDIQTKNVLEKIVALAKQGYGGNLDMAIRTQEVRDLVELYAMSTGQGMGAGSISGRMQPVSMVQISGSLYRQSSPTASLAPVSGGGGGTVVIPLSIDGRAVGTAVLQNGRVVADGALQASRSNYRRTEAALSTLSPNTIRV
jgi:hypothetical protein